MTNPLLDVSWLLLRLFLWSHNTLTMIRNNTLLSSCSSSHWGESAMVEEANWDCCNFPFSSYWWRSLEKSGQKVRKQWQQQQSVSLWLFLWKVEASGFYCFQYTILSLSGQRSILPTKVRDFRNEGSTSTSFFAFEVVSL